MKLSRLTYKYFILLQLTDKAVDTPMVKDLGFDTESTYTQSINTSRHKKDPVAN